VITAVDTNVLLDVFAADVTFGPASRLALRRCLAEGRVVACDAVIAEVIAAFPEVSAARAALAALPVDFDAPGEEAATRAGEVFREYRRKGGRRARVAADFLIGAHAAVQADRLLTRDRGFYRDYFAGLTVLDPGA
jgi:predicted nucleic acid-binding protein